MKLILKHYENIKTFVDISHHLELKAKHMGVHQNTLLVAQSRQRKAIKPKCKGQGRNAKGVGNLGPKEGKIAKHQKGKRAKKDKAKFKCYGCSKKDHFINALSQRRYPFLTTLLLLMFAHMFLLLILFLGGL